MAKKVLRQGMVVTINQLKKLIKSIRNEFKEEGHLVILDRDIDDLSILITITNKTPEQCDTWEIEK